MKHQLSVILALLVFVVFSADVLVADLTEDLVAHYKLDGDANNVAGAGDGTLKGNPQWVNGKIDGALELDGDGDYVVAELAPVLDITGSITIAAWVKVNSWGLDRYDNIIYKQIEEMGDRAYRLSRDASSDGACFTLNAVGGEAKVRGTKPINDGEWHHVVGMYDMDAGEAYLYVDSVLDTAPVLTSGEIKDSTDTPLYICRDPDSNVGQRDLNGLVDDVAIWSRALTVDEIVEVMAEGIPPSAMEPGGKLITPWASIKKHLFTKSP